MILFLAITISLIAMFIIALCIANSDRLSKGAKAVILPNYFVAIAFLLIIFFASLMDALEI